MWRENILELMLDSRKWLLHQIIAESLELVSNGRKRNIKTIIPIVNPKIKKLFLIEVTPLPNPRVPRFSSKIPLNQHCKA